MKTAQAIEFCLKYHEVNSKKRPSLVINLFSLRVNTPLLAALSLEISFVEIPRSLLRGVSFFS